MSTAASQKTPPQPPGYRDDPMTREVLRGLELMSPRPSLQHALCAGQLHMVLAWTFGRSRGPGGPGRPGGSWWILPEPELHLEAEDPIVPDIAGWRQERLSFFPRGSSTKIPPDWVCEVLSPKTEKLDRSTKMEIYADAGVGHIWLVEPIRQQLEVFVLAGRQYRRMASRVGEEVVNAAPFDSLALELSELWPPS